MNRKDEHVSLAKAFYQEQTNDFDLIRFVHHALPETNQAAVDISTNFLGFHLPAPFYINAMTGGSERTGKINRDLAIVARETNLLIASGSVNSALKDPELAATFTVLRKENPAGVIFANLSAAASVAQAQQAVALLAADGLQLHLNAPQELVMPEGDRDFTGWLENIGEITQTLDVPVIVKEVGFGMSSETLESLRAVGVQAVDISGRGGTSFTQIENSRRTHHEFAYLDSWGQSTAESLLESLPFQNQLTILASGGVRNPLDILKALSLGAKSVGISGVILNQLLTNGVAGAIALIQAWQAELATLYTLVGKTRTDELLTTDLILSGELRDWCDSRGINYQQLAHRN